MKKNIKPCIEQHLPDKARPGTAVPSDVWFDAAEAHVRSARAIIDADPSGAFLLGWSAMHKTAKGVAADGETRLEGETHGKVVDFLCCVFAGLSDKEKGLVRRPSTGRNSLSYDDPRVSDRRVIDDVISLAERLLAAGRSGTQPKDTRPIPPPPPAPAPAP
jgi:hypothetical protein